MAYRSIKTNGVCIRTGNEKLGAVMNVSLLPGASCNPSVPCYKLCYDAKLANFRSSIKLSRLNNWNIYKTTPEVYFEAIRVAITKGKPEYFRWHAGGDIPDQTYFDNMVQIAHEFPGVKFLAMTKSKQLDLSHNAPNLTVLASQWGEYQWGDDNIGKTDIRFKEDKKTRMVQPNEFLCPGGCEACGYHCWSVKAGEQVVFDQH